MTYRVSKTYGHDLGISTCFRQWKAPGHCKYLHGYALSFKFVFECDELDEHGWCVDFGNLKGLKCQLELNFDHKTLIAADDPQLELMQELAEHHCADLKVLPEVGCEAFAKLAYDLAVNQLSIMGMGHRVRVLSCECAEHGTNSAIYEP